MAELDLTVNVDTKGTGKLDKLGGALGGVAKNAGLLVAGVAGAGAAAGGVFVALAAEAEEAQAKLDSVFTSTGAAAWTSVDALNAHAEALTKTTTFDDDSIKGAQAALLSFGNISEEQFSEATAASADLAEFMETDIVSAAEQLGKALADPEKGVAKLRRAGINLTDEEEKMVQAMIDVGDTAGAQQVILEAVSGRIGNVAEDLAGTSGGQMQQAMHALGEAGEAIGMALLPLLGGLATVLKGFAEWVQANMPAIQGVFTTVFGAIGAGISFFVDNILPPLVLAFQTVVGWVQENLPSIQGTASGVFDTISGAISWVAENVLPKLIEVFTGVVAWVSENMPTISSVVGQIFGAIQSTIEAVWPIIESVASVLFPLLGTAAGVLLEVMDVAFKGIGGAFEVLGTVFETVGGIIEDVFNATVGFVKGLWNSFVGVWNGIGIDVPQVEIPFFGVIGGFSLSVPDLPYLAEGGIVTQPTLAVIGERGPEAVVPLDKGIGAHETHIHLTYAGEPPEEPRDLVALLLQVAPFVDGRLRVVD